MKRSLTIYKSVKSHLDIYPSEAAFNSAREDNEVGKLHSIFFQLFTWKGSLIKLPIASNKKALVIKQLCHHHELAIIWNFTRLKSLRYQKQEKRTTYPHLQRSWTD